MSRILLAVAPILFLFVFDLQVTPATAFELANRWTRTATNGTSVGSQGSPITLTWSFAPDGTSIPGNPSSNVISFLDATYGAGPGGSDYTLRPWFPSFQQAFDRITALSGVTYVYEPNDDGVSFTSLTSGRGTLGVRGDIRIGGKSYGEGSTTLASNYYPSYGEMMFNTDRGDWYSNTSNNYRRLRNVIMHEAMHGLGIEHVESSSSGFLIEPTISTSFDGPQLDDLLAIQRHYGDFREKNGGNNTFGTATSLGTVTATQARQLGTLGSSTAIASTQTDFISIDDNSDTDFFSFTINSRLDVRLLMTPRGTTYQVGSQGGTQSSFNSLTLSDLSLALFDTNGTSLLSSVNANPAGVAEEIRRQLLPGTYYARVTGAQDNIQLYGILASATTPLPATLVWTGNVDNIWDSGTTANFQNAGSSSLFWDFDNVTFDDTTSVKSVSLANSVSAGQVQINTDSSYIFTGAAGLIAGTVAIGGNGTVEFANSGNSYAGNTVINSGTLAITGNANAMRSLMIVNGGATLLMDASDAATMTSNFSIAANGVLHIGTETSTGNVFPDNPASIVNNGTIRVFDEELLQSVSGTGILEIEQETTTLRANPNFHGTVFVKANAVARVIDSNGLGSASAVTTLNSGGTLLVDGSPTIASALQLTGNGGGSGAVQVTSSNNATFNGDLILRGEQAVLQADTGATATFSSLADGLVDQTTLVLQSDFDANVRLTGGLVLNGGGITKRGVGTAEVFGTVDYGGETNVEAGSLRLLGLGTLTGPIKVGQDAVLEIGESQQLASSVRLSGNGQVSGDLVMPGIIAPGESSGTLTLLDDLALVNGSSLEIEIGGTQSGVDFDLLQVVGLASLSGELQVTLIDDFLPQNGDAFEILNAFGGVESIFESTVLPTLEDGLSWNVEYGSNYVLLAVQAAAMLLPGDYNRDAVVNAADYVLWRDTLGSMELLDADGNLSGTVDESDLPVWSANFGNASASGNGTESFASLSVPEPGMLRMTVLVVFLLFAVHVSKRLLGRISRGNAGVEGFCRENRVFIFGDINQFRAFSPRKSGNILSLSTWTKWT